MEDQDGLPSVPAPGNWPVDPQDDQTISDDRIWVDGCFDFVHHGHAGAMLQARKLGKELTVGVHSDEEILKHKGPTIMTLKERIAAVDACRWATKSIPCAPYVTSLPWISHYGCKFVVHGDDITSDSSGEDCYRFVKAAGRFRVVKRTPGISTTDLVGRMLLCTKNHFISSLSDALAGNEGPGSLEERALLGQDMRQRIRDYATDDTGLKPGPRVLSWVSSEDSRSMNSGLKSNLYQTIVDGIGPRSGQRIVYVDGGFDLFCSGHIEFLRQVEKAEQAMVRREKRDADSATDYGAPYIVAGIHDDDVINRWKGMNYPIMNILERGLCVLQCRYVNSVIFSAPFTPSRLYLTEFPFGKPDAVYHGPTSFIPLDYDPYKDAKELGIYQEIGPHTFDEVNAGEIVQRILKSRKKYEERQRAKGEKAATEAQFRNNNASKH